MAKITEITGNRYGALVVLKISGKNKSGNLRWLCKCDCGKEKVIDGPHLRSGRVKSCGCLTSTLISEKLSGENHYLYEHGHSKTSKEQANNRRQPKRVR